MIAVRVTCDTGKTWETDINGDLASASKYFLGQCFTDENQVTGEETRNIAVKVEQVTA